MKCFKCEKRCLTSSIDEVDEEAQSSPVNVANGDSASPTLCHVAGEHGVEVW